MAAFFLTEEDVRTLQEALRIVQTLKANPQGRYTPRPHTESPPVTYVALTPEGGIPALNRLGTGTGTGTGTDLGPGDIPGSAACDIYRLDDNGQLQNQKFQRTVHNVSTTAITGDTWVVIDKDPWGKWWATDVTSLEDIDCGESAVVVYDYDLRCEGAITGTGTGPQFIGDLNLYQRAITLNIVNGCLTRSVGGWDYVKTVDCCDPDCAGFGTGTTPAGTGTGDGNVGETCGSCEVHPLAWSLSVAGVTNDKSCTDCNDYNGSWTLTHQGSCSWATSAEAAVCGAPSAPVWTLQYNASKSRWELIPNETIPLGQDQVLYILADASWNCLGSNTLSRLSFNDNCTSWPATLTLNPV